jgi:vacuole morphology and inheritance protein 14
MEQESILPTATVRNLSDKLYEKRKNAALDIERIVKEHQINHSSEKIESLIRVLDLNFAMSSNLHSRKGGLIGLAAIASGLSRADCYSYTGQLVYPVLTCFADPDSRVRYYACEALYNIVKVARTSVLLYFKDVFDNLSKLIADTDNNVKNGADLLDRLLKDVISESSEFDLVAFIPLLRERIYTEHPNARRFIVSWIDMLGAIPDIDMLQYLPELLDGLFVILSDTSVEVDAMIRHTLIVIRRTTRGHNDMPFGRPTPAGLSGAWGLATLRAYLVFSVTWSA